MGIPTFEYADTATRLFNYMWQYAYNLKALYETPTITEETGEHAPDRQLVHDMLSEIRGSGRTILTEAEFQANSGGLWHPHDADACRHKP